MRLLQRTFSDLGTIAEPHAFARFVERKGLAVTLEPVAVPAGKALKVTVPDKGLALLFVTRELCGPASGVAR